MSFCRIVAPPNRHDRLPARIALAAAEPRFQIQHLVVEDEPTSREIVDFVLSGAGYGVDMAATAAAALMLLSSTRYGLVVADWMLPEGDGIYIADRALALGSQTLIITGHLPDLPPGTGQRHRVLSKPAKPAELLAVVRDMIGEPPVSS